MDMSVNEVFEEYELLDFSPSNSWLQLLAKPVNDLPPSQRPHGNTGRGIYTYDHPLVSKARSLKNAGALNNNRIAKGVGVCPKTISRWQEKGFLNDQKST